VATISNIENSMIINCGKEKELELKKGDAEKLNDLIKELEGLKTKYNFQGEIGAEVFFDYHKPSGRYYQRGGEVQDYNYLEQKKQDQKEFLAELIPFPTIDPVDAFAEPYKDDDSDVPF
jgi:hypothetical protein